MNRWLSLVIIFWLGINLSVFTREMIEWKHGFIAISLLLYREDPRSRQILPVIFVVLSPAYIITLLVYYISFRIHIFRETSKMMNDFIDVMYYQQVDLWNGATGLEKLHRKMILRRVVRDKVLELQSKW